MSNGAVILYLVFVALSIGGVVGVLFALGQGQRATLTEAEARAFFLARFADVQLGAARTAPHMVFFDLSDGVGLVRAQGRRPVARWVRPAEVTGLTRDQGRLVISLRDFADPHIVVTGPDLDALEQWLTLRLLPKAA